MNLLKIIEALEANGYKAEDARARLCQDIVLKAISESSLSKNVTIKGGVVMRSLTGNIRRATQDIDIDFIRYGLSQDLIDVFIEKLNCLKGIVITRIGKIEELNQQDYKGKRVYIKISDDNGNVITSKIDLGVHNHMELDQEEYCFDIAFDDEGASLLINTKEQMFTEKLRSLMKFGSFNTRYKDIYDMYYQCEKLDESKLYQCFQSLIFNDKAMRENDTEGLVKRIESIFSDKIYKQRVDKSDKRWLDDDIEVIFSKIVEYLKGIKSV